MTVLFHRGFYTGLSLLAGCMALSAQPYVYVANSGNNNVGIINGGNHTLSANINVSPLPGGIGVTPDGSTVYVSSAFSNNVSAMNTSDKTMHTIGVGVNPTQLAISPNGALVYVVDQGANQVSVISTSSQSVTATIGVGSHPASVAFHPSGTRAFVTNLWDNTVSSIDTSSNSVTTFSTGFSPSGIAVTPDGQSIYVTCQGANTVTVHDASGNILRTIHGFSSPVGVAITPDGTHAFVVNANSNTVSRIDLASNTIVGTTSVGTLPTAVTTSTDGTEVYVTNELDFSVSVLRASDGGVISTIPHVGIYPVAVATIPPASQAPPPPPPPPPTQTCTYSLSASGSFTSFGGNSSVTVTTQSGCAWAASSNNGWLSITNGASGSGSGTVFYSVSANQSPNALSGSLTIAGQTFSVTEAGISCSYSLSASATNVPLGGGTGSVVANAPTGCPWTVSSDSQWLTVTSATSGSGSGTVQFQAPANTGTARTGNLNIGGLGFTVTQAGYSTSAPTVDSVSPNSGTGITQSFTFRYSSVNGASYLNGVYALINGSLSAASGCSVYYVPSKGLYLANDSASAAFGPLALGSSDSLQNGQCTINGSTSSASGNGNTLSLTLGVTFAGRILGTQNLYGYAQDSGNQNSGWRTLGSWVPRVAVSTPPTADQVSPSAGSGSSQNFTFKYSSQNGFGYLNVVYALINGNLIGSNSCLIYYLPTTNGLYLANDSDTAVSGPVTPGSTATLRNSQCSLNAAMSAAVGSGNTLALTLGLSFSSKVIGTQVLYGFSQDTSSQSSGWQILGSWAARDAVNAPPTIDVVTPTSDNPYFTYRYSSQNGSSYLQTVYAMFNGGLTVANGCVVSFVQATNALYLLNDSATALLGPILPGSSDTLQNSQCAIPGSNTAVSASGNTLYLTVAPIFSPSFKGNKVLFGYAFDNGNQASGWQNLGNWTF